MRLLPQNADSYVLRLVRLIHAAEESPDVKDWKEAAIPWYERAADGTILRVNTFPDSPGIYAIARQYPKNGKIRSRVLYVGMSRGRQGIKGRLHTHFGRKKSDLTYTGSRFANAMWEILQDNAMVQAILSSESVRIAVLPLPDDSEDYIRALERLAISVLRPLLNIEG